MAVHDPSRNIARRAANAVLAISFDHFVNRGDADEAASVQATPRTPTAYLSSHTFARSWLR
jgi:hypothetical protein